jgi:hypothetical protein
MKEVLDDWPWQMFGISSGQPEQTQWITNLIMNRKSFCHDFGTCSSSSLINQLLSGKSHETRLVRLWRWCD